MENPEARIVTAISIIRLSIRSEKYPIGHCKIAPNELIITINNEISKVVRFLKLRAICRRRREKKMKKREKARKQEK